MSKPIAIYIRRNTVNGGSKGSPFAGKSVAEMDAIRRKWSNAQMGKKATAETRIKLSRLNKGKVLMRISICLSLRLLFLRGEL